METIKIVTILAIMAVVSVYLLFALPTWAQEPLSRRGLVTLDDKPLTLIGPELKAGDEAPSFNLVDSDSNPVTNKDFEGKVMVISVMPSIDTPT